MMREIFKICCDFSALSINAVQIAMGVVTKGSSLRRLVRLGFFFGLAASSVEASAATYNWAVVDGASNLFGAGTITTSDTANSLGGYDILAATGFFNVKSYNGTNVGGQVIGLVNNPNSPNAAATPYASYLKTYDNVLYPKAPTSNASVLDTSGIAFITTYGYANVAFYGSFASGLGGGPIASYFLGETPNSQSYYVYNNSYFFGISPAISTAPVPEIATWAMMIAGFAAIGLAVRRRRTVMPRVIYNA